MPVKEKYIVWEPFLLSLAVVFGMLAGGKMWSSALHTEPHLEGVGEIGSIEEVLRFVEVKYVDSVDREQLTRAAIDAILGSLDPHSRYIPPSEVQAIKEDMEGRYHGVGIQLTPTLDSLWMVAHVVSGSPAQKAGVSVGMRLLKVDSLILADTVVGYDFVSNHIKGPLDSKVTLTFEDMVGKEGVFVLERSTIDIPSVDLAYMFNDTIGVIKVNRFSERTYREFMQALEDLSAQGLDDLIVDLSGNPGGYLQETVKIISQFVPDKDKLLVYTMGDHSRKNEYKSNGRIFHPVDDIVLIVDQNSASASEIMAGALQDLDRALVLGRRSFGKGLVQEQYGLNNGGAVRLTTARYYIPSGRLIQRDYDDSWEYEHDLQDRYENGEWSEDHPMLVFDSTRYYTENGRPVFGGGGVTPDVFVSDPNPFSYVDWPWVSDLLRRYVTTFFLQNARALHYDMDAYLSDFRFDDRSEEEILLLLGKEWPQIPLGQPRYKRYLMRMAKGMLAQYVFNDMSAMSRVLYNDDHQLLKATEMIEDDKVDKYLSHAK